MVTRRSSVELDRAPSRWLVANAADHHGRSSQVVRTDYPKRLLSLDTAASKRTLHWEFYIQQFTEPFTCHKIT